MRATPITDPPTTTTPSPAACPETVMVCQLIGGDILVHGVPDGPLTLLTGPDADPLRTAIHTALNTTRGTSASRAGAGGAS